MTVNIKVTKNACKLSFTDEMRIYCIEEIKDKILSQWGDWKKLDLDLKEVEEIDGAGLQLLFSLKKTCEAEEKKFQISSTNTAIDKLLNLYHLDKTLNPIH